MFRILCADLLFLMIILAISIMTMWDYVGFFRWMNPMLLPFFRVHTIVPGMFQNPKETPWSVNVLPPLWAARPDLCEVNVGHYLHGRFAQMGITQNGWFIRENPDLKLA